MTLMNISFCFLSESVRLSFIILSPYLVVKERKRKTEETKLKTMTRSTLSLSTFYVYRAFYSILFYILLLINLFNRLNNSCHSLLLFFLGASANQLLKASVDESRRSGSKIKPLKDQSHRFRTTQFVFTFVILKALRKELCGWTAKFTLVACGKDLNFGHICSFGVPSMRKCLSI